MINYFESEPMKYFAPSSTMSKDARHMKLEQMAASGNYMFGEKTDGNWSRAVITKERCALQTRGISKVTGTYGEVQNKVLFWNSICDAFSDTTVILGEIYLPGGIDKDTGAILRCLDAKALARQKVTPLRWRVFDILALDGDDYMNEPFEYRISHIPEVVGRINSPYVEGVQYYEMNESFFDKIADIFEKGGEGAVCYKKDSIYIPGKRGPHAWDTVKVKQEIEQVIDCFITGIEPPEKNYNGDHLEAWPYWEDQRTGEKLYGNYYIQYTENRPIIPISKNYYNNWPCAIMTSIYDKQGNIIPLCKISGLTEEFKASLRDWFKSKWYMCPVSIGGMMISTANANNDGSGISIRHPYLKSIRDGDIKAEDCTLEKIYN